MFIGGKIDFQLLFLGFLLTILVLKLNFDSDKLLSGKEITFLKNSSITVCAVEQSEPTKLAISHNIGLRFYIKFLRFSVKLFTFSVSKATVC